MTFITILIIVVFVVGYALIALESATHINKAAVALLMCVACWTLYMIHPADYLPGVTTDLLSSRINTIIEEHLGSISTTLFFLMGAMTIVEVVDQYGGFNFVRDTLKTQSKRGLLWRVVALTFILSAILDNMTTTIVMIMVLRKLVRDHSDRIIYASLIILAANAGGAFSPIGDVTTIMLWNVGSITAAGVIEELLIPSAISIFIPTLILQYKLHGALVEPDASTEETAASVLSGWQHKAVFVLGVGGLIFVPIFRYLTDLPPFVGILLVLAVLWTVTELFFRLSKRAKTAGDMGKRVSQLLGRVDMSTILFFLGILMTVACLEEVPRPYLPWQPLPGDGLHRRALQHRGQRASRGWLHRHVPPARGGSLCRRWCVLATPGLLCWRGRIDTDHRQRRRRSGDGSGEDQLWMVRSSHLVGSPHRLSRWHRELLPPAHLCFLIFTLSEDIPRRAEGQYAFLVLAFRPAWLFRLFSALHHRKNEVQRSVLWKTFVSLHGFSIIEK